MGVLWLWPRETPSVRRLLAIAAALFAGMLCKEVVLFTVPALVLWSGCRAASGHVANPIRAGVVGAARVAAAPIVAVVVYLAARAAALGGMKAGGSALDLVGVAQRVPVLWWDALATLFAPRTLMMRHLAEAYAELSLATVALAAAGAVALGGAALSSLRRRPELAVGLGWYAATLAPAVLVSFTPGWAGFGRYLYIPSVGVAIALLSLVPAVHRSDSAAMASVRRLAPLIAALYLFAMAMLSTLVTLNYESNLSFYLAIAEEQPNRAHGHRGVGETLLGLGQPELAIPSLQQAIALQPNLRRPHVNLAKSLAQLGRFEEAEAAALVGLERFETNPNLWQILSMSRMSLGRGDAVTPLLNARELAGDAPWLDDYLDYVLLEGPPEFLQALETSAQIRDPDLADRLR
jgi:tetratricopeptide (TPR) repeat protein